MESYKRFSFATRSVQEASSSMSNSGTSQSSDGQPGTNGSSFPKERADTTNSATSNSSSGTSLINGNSNTQLFTDGAGDNARRANISRLPLAVWRMKNSPTMCRGETSARQGERHKHDVLRLPVLPTTSISRESDFDSVFHESDNETYVKPKDQCERFEWSDIVMDVWRPQRKLSGDNGDNATNRRTAACLRSDWVATEKLEKLAVKEDKRIKKQEIVDVYTGGLNQTPSVPVKAGQRTSAYINRKAKEREIARINSIMIKKILNVKSTLPTRR